MTQPEKILVIPLRYIGDTIVSIPMLKNLYHHYHSDGTTIDMLCSKVTAPLMENSPYLDKVLIEQKSLMTSVKQLKEQQYDTVIIMRKSFTMALICKLAGIKIIIGYDKQRFFPPIGYKRWGMLLTHKSPYPSIRTDKHQARHHLKLLSHLHIQPEDMPLELWSTADDEQKIDTLLASEGVDNSRPIAIFHGASPSSGKNVPSQLFSKALIYLHQQGYNIVCTGIESDAAMYESLTSSNLPLINLAGKTTLTQLIPLYKKAKLLLSVDSSPVHIAAAMNVPHIVAVYGPTNEKQWGPYSSKSHFVPVIADLSCRPCHAPNRCHDNWASMLEAEQIEKAVQSTLSKVSEEKATV